MVIEEFRERKNRDTGVLYVEGDRSKLKELTEWCEKRGTNKTLFIRRLIDKATGISI